MTKYQEMRQIASILLEAEEHQNRPLPESLNSFLASRIVNVSVALINQRMAINSSLWALKILSFQIEGNQLSQVCNALDGLCYERSQDHEFCAKCQ